MQLADGQRVGHEPRQLGACKIFSINSMMMQQVCGERPGSQRLGSQGSVRKRLGSHGLGSHGLGSQGSVRKRLANTNSRERRGGTETREPRFLRTEPREPRLLRTEPREPRRGNRDLANRACTVCPTKLSTSLKQKQNTHLDAAGSFFDCFQLFL